MSAQLPYRHSFSQLPEKYVRQIAALDREPDPDVYRHGLLTIGRALIGEGREDLASPLLAELAETPDGYAREAERLRSLTGASAAERIERYAQVFSSEVRRPEFFAAWAAGGLALRGLGAAGKRGLAHWRTRAGAFEWPWLATGESRAFAGAGRFPPPAPRALVAPQSFAVSSGGGGGGLPEAWRETLAKRIKLPADHPRFARILKNIDDHPFGASGAYREMLLGMRLPGKTIYPRHGVYESLSAADLLEQSTWFFQRSANLDSRRTAFGTYFDYLMQSAFQEILARGLPSQFVDLLTIAGGHPSVVSLESLFASAGLAPDYHFFVAGWKSSPRLFSLEQRVDEWPLGRPSRSTIKSYLARLEIPDSLPTGLQPGENIVSFADGKRVSVDADRAWSAFDRVLGQWERDRDWDSISLLDKALTRVSISQVPLLVMDYLVKVLMTGDAAEKTVLLPKVAELAHGEEFDWFDLNHAVQSAKNPEGIRAPGEDELAGTVFFGYLDDRPLVRRLLSLYQEIPRLTEATAAAARRRDFERMVEKLLAEDPGPFRGSHVLRMLAHNATTASRLAADRIARGDLEFRLVGETELRLYWNQSEEPLPVALFAPPDRRPPSDPAKPLILVLDQWNRVPETARADYALHLCRCVVHEFAHFLRDFKEGGKGYFTGFGEQLKSEMFAANEDQFFALSQGYVEEWKRAARHPYGWPAYLRGEIEREYLGLPRYPPEEKA